MGKVHTLKKKLSGLKQKLANAPLESKIEAGGMAFSVGVMALGVNTMVNPIHGDYQYLVDAVYETNVPADQLDKKIKYAMYVQDILYKISENAVKNKAAGYATSLCDTYVQLCQGIAQRNQVNIDFSTPIDNDVLYDFVNNVALPDVTAHVLALINMKNNQLNPNIENER